MFRRIFGIGLLACASLPAARDWKAFPPIADRPAVTAIYAIGDIHGDYDRLVTLLKAAHILEATPDSPEKARWSAGKATLVVTGDMIDKGPKPVSVLRALRALRADAPRSGGEVILLAGNHEAEFLAGPDAKKAADFITDLKKQGYAPEQVAACGTDLGEFLCTLPFAARVGDWFFSHGGNTAGRTVAQISDAIVKGVDQDGYGTKALTAPDSLLEARLGEGKQPWIDAPGFPGQRALLQSCADALGVKHMAQGHQPGEVKFADGVTRKVGQIFERWELLYLIDVGMSSGVDDSHGAVLRIAVGQVDAVYPDGSHLPVATSN
jgi:hypothetical protein